MGICIGIVTVRGPDYHPTRRLAEAAVRRGHRAVAVHPYRVWPVLRNGRCHLLADETFPALDVVLPRQGAEVATACLALIEQFEHMGLAVVNSAGAIRLARHKFFALQALAAARLPVPATVFVNSPAALAAAVDRLGGYPLVVKAVSGRQGKGITRADSAREGRRVMSEVLDRRSGLLLQEYVPPQGRSDLRVLVIGGATVGAVALTPRTDDFRANFHLGGNVRPLALAPEVAQLSQRAAQTLGLEVAGVDLMRAADGRTVIMEVNYAPGFKGFEAATGLDVAGRIVDHAVVRSRSSRSTKLR
jgi:ribosomal protein S6--L-glutamate ligase